MSDNAISGKKLKVAYDNEFILDDLDIEIPLGKITAIIGPNGCGKSTLLKSLARLTPLKQGSVLLYNQNINDYKNTEVAKKMAVLPQSPVAPNDLTVEDLVSLGRYPHQKGLGKLTAQDKAKIEWALNITKLSNYKDRNLNVLSGGQRQRVWIAMALAQDSDLILLDEPTTYLDLVHQLDVLELLVQLNSEQNKTIVLVIHELNMAARFSNHIIAMKDGKIVKEGSPNEIITEKVLKEVFSIDAHIVTDSVHNNPVILSFEKSSK